MKSLYQLRMYNKEQDFDLQASFPDQQRFALKIKDEGEGINIPLFNKYIPSACHAPASAQGPWSRINKHYPYMH